MSILPWDDWFYDNDYRKEEVDELKIEVTSTASFYNAEIDNFKSYYTNYRNLVLLNSSLAIMAKTIPMSDEQYSNLTTTLEGLPEVTEVVSSSVESTIDAFVLWPKFIKCVYNIGSLVKNKIFDSSSSESSDVDTLSEDTFETLAESSEDVGIETLASESATELTSESIGEAVGESAAEAAIEGAALSTWEAFGIGVVLAIGFDAIFGLLNGAKEKEELDEDIDKLQSAMSKLLFAQNTLVKKISEMEANIIVEEQRYNGIITALAKTVDSDSSFTLDTDCTVENADTFISEGGSAITYFSDYVNFKYDWFKVLENNANITKQAFFDAFNEFNYKQLSDDQLNAYWDILSQYSSSMSDLDQSEVA